MFKAAFPLASLAEEEAERTYHKTLPTAGNEEVAGNVWIAPEDGMCYVALDRTRWRLTGSNSTRACGGVWLEGLDCGARGSRTH